jgi:transcription antitermination factor NusG
MGSDVKAGEEVSIKSGPLNDFSGIFKRKISARDRIRVLLQVLDTPVSVNISETPVERVR